MTQPRLTTLLSWALVAFTIDADNAFELSMPHRTATDRRTGQLRSEPWLASMFSWYACLQFVPAEGIELAELNRLTFGECRLRGPNSGMIRWGYVTIEDRVVRPTEAGMRASSKWAELPALIEQRWVDRHGAGAVGRLRTALESALGGIDYDLPDAVPENAAGDGRVDIALRPVTEVDRPRDLAALLAKVLVDRTRTHEAASGLSLSHAANPIRALGAGDLPSRDFPRRTGVAKETLTAMTNWLAKQGFVAVTGAGRTKTVGLTDKGREAFEEYTHASEAADEQLRGALEPIVAALDLTPPQGTWRAKRPTPETLPHHPVISHRGGYPDGS